MACREQIGTLTLSFMKLTQTCLLKKVSRPFVMKRDLKARREGFVLFQFLILLGHFFFIWGTAALATELQSQNLGKLRQSCGPGSDTQNGVSPETRQPSGGGTAQGLCPSDSPPRENAFEWGIQALSVLPNRLPQFTGSVPIFGAIVGVPLLGQHLQFQANYGTLTGFTLHTFESSYRHRFALPFATPFVQFGGHYLRYRFVGVDHTYWGFHGATGFSFGMTRNFDINLFVKVYVQDRPLFSYGGALVLLW